MSCAKRGGRAARLAAVITAAAAGIVGFDRRVWADPALPTIPANTFNIVNFGASTTNTAAQNFTAISSAIGSCNAAGGGTIIVPPGLFQSSPGITIGSSTNLEIDGTLQAPPISAYGSAGTNFLTISSSDHDVEISGSGTIDGNATFSTGSGDTEWWGNPTLNIAAQGTRPRLVQITKTTRIWIRNVHVQNGPTFHFAFSGNNNNVTIDGITISAPGNSPNTDGIDLTGTLGLVKNCNISVGDDNVVMKPGSAFCATFTVSSCTFGTGHGVSIGGQTNLGLNTFNVTSCTFNGTANGIHLKAGRGAGGLVQNVNVSNLTMTNVTNPFDISSYYINGGDVSGPLTATHIPTGQTLPGAPVLADASQTFVSGMTPQWQNVTFSNIQINGSSSNSFFYGLPEAPIQNLVLDNINYQTTPANALSFVNNSDVHLTGTTAAPIQCAVVSSLELSGAPGSPVTLTQSFNSSLASQAVVLKGNSANYYNFDPNFDPASVNTVRVSGDMNLGRSAGTSGVYNLNGGTLNVGGVLYVGNAGTGVMNVNGGTVITIAAAVGNAATGAGTLTITSGGFSAGSTTVGNNSLLSYNGGAFSPGTLQLATGGRVVLSPGANKVLVTPGIAIDPTSQIDLADNFMVINYGASIGTLADDVRQHLLNHRIINSVQAPGMAIGYGDNAVLGLSSFGGIGVGTSSLLMKSTFIGDTNLDGRVDILDLFNLATHFNSSGNGWTGGDFNYDGVVDATDLSLLAAHWQDGVPASAGMPLDAALAALDLPSVPEPVLCGPLGLALAAIIRHRRR